MRGDLYDGFLPLAGQFPPSVNSSDDPVSLKIFESPSCYGVDCNVDGYLKTGSIPSGTTRTTRAYTIDGNVYTYYFNRCWRASGTTLYFGSPEYTTKYLPQGLGRLVADASIITFMPVLGNDLWVATATGSQVIRNADDSYGRYELQKFKQELFVPAAAQALVLNDDAVVCNANGVFSWNGQTLKEWTRPVRYSTGNFTNKNITAHYARGQIIGASSFVVDTTTGKLFDYGTSGFRFTSRTIANPATYSPLQVASIRLIYSLTNPGGTVSWQTKFDEDDWHTEEDIEIQYTAGEYTGVTRPLQGDKTTGQKFQMRLTALDDDIKIREILVLVGRYALGAIAE